MNLIKKNFSVLFIIIACAAVVGIGMWYIIESYFKSSQAVLMTATTYKNTKKLKDFSLLDYDTNKFSLAQMRGHWTLLFFGYQNCPDVCPITLGTMRDVWRQSFGSKQQPSARFVFVEISNQVHNPLDFKNFVQGYDPRFIGVYGSAAQVKELSQQLGVYYEDAPDRINHSGQIFLINPQGKLAASFSPPFYQHELIRDLKTLTQ